LNNDNLIKKVAQSPAIALEKTISTSQQVTQKIVDNGPIKTAKNFWNGLGPGVVTGASDDDPAGIATYSQTGAQYGFQLLWLSAFTFPLMAVIQEMCARIGMVTGRGLASNIRNHFPKWLIYITALLLLLANSFNIGANLGAMARVTQLLRPELNFAVMVVIFTVLTLLLQIFLPYQKYAQYLKYLALVLLTYIITAFIIKDFDWGLVLRSAVTPSFNFTREQIFLICAILGTTISPYLFFWQTSQEIEEKILEGQTTIKLREDAVDNKQIGKMRTDVWSGMFFSNLVMFFIIAVCAVTLYSAGITNIETAADAAAALKPLAGENAALLFALGIVGTGMLAIPVLAGSASYAVSEVFGWKEGLYLHLKNAYAFYGVIMIAMLVGLGMNFVGIPPIKALIYSAVLNGLIAPIILIPIVLISSNKKIMGERANHPFTAIIGWITVILMVLAGVATIVSFFI